MRNETPLVRPFRSAHYRVYDKLKRLRYDLVGNDCLKAPEIAKQLVAEP